MSERCGPTSQCKTTRCVCKKNNRPCKFNCPTCKCNSDICSNASFANFDGSDSGEDGCNCSISNCTDNRCGCKKSNNVCNDACNCSRSCKNKVSNVSFLYGNDSEEDGCNCTSSNCADYRCGCKKSNNVCSNMCNCGKNCKNKVQKVFLNEKDGQNEFRVKSSISNRSNNTIDVSINDIASEITKSIRKNNLSSIRDNVFEFRDNIDFYSGIHKKKITDPHVDHVIEDQILGHAAARVLKSKNHEPYLDSLKDSINLESLENYNVTFSGINTSKGSVIRNYLRDNNYRGLPLRAAILNETKIDKYKISIQQLMNDTYPIVVSYLESDECRRTDGHATGSRTFSEIANELSNIISEMDLNSNSERRLRKK